MNCAWKEMLTILPTSIRSTTDRLGRDGLQEIRLRLNMPAELIIRGKSFSLPGHVTREDLMFCVNTASRYSPWAASTVSQGYLTAPGGHRVGLCGEAVVKNDMTEGIRNVSSLCIRVARDFPGLAKSVAEIKGSVLLVGPPGSGKTTFLRDLIRQRSELGSGSVAVVDERGEIFPPGNIFPQGKRTDVLTGCGKEAGIDMVLRSMGPGTIAVDEITAEADCQALIKAGWCGVNLLATAHASSKNDLHCRPVYQPLVKSRLFETVIVMKPDKSWHVERMEP